MDRWMYHGHTEGRTLGKMLLSHTLTRKGSAVANLVDICPVD